MTTLTHGGSSIPVEPDAFRRQFASADGYRRQELREMVLEGTFEDANGEPLDLKTAERVRRRMLGVATDPNTVAAFGEQLRQRREAGGARFLIPGLWPWGTYPQLGGNPKAGKTTFIAELCASLVRPGRRLLDHFEPTGLTDEERDVVLVNTEMESGAVLDALAAAGVESDDHLSVVNLRDEGGARAFDLTDPEVYDRWVDRLVWCDKCDGSDEYPPSVVIVDNLTAVLQDLQRPLEHYGTLHGLFVQLMQEIGCPNGLTVVHNTLAGGHAMGGTTGQNRPDGLWSYWSSNADDPNAKRYFQVVPRLGGEAVRRRRVLLEEGRLRLAEKAEEAPVATAERDEPDYVAEVLEALEAAGAEGLLRLDVTGRGRRGKHLREALDSLIESGEVIQIQESGVRGRPSRCWAAAFVGDPQ